MKSSKVVILAAIACAAAAAVALAQQKVAGEKWRMKMSMQAEGFTMPATTREMCLPVGNTQEAMLSQGQGQNNSSCSVTNFRQSGNRFSADMKCTGKDAMEGHMEFEQLSPDSARGSMTAKTADGSMKMEYEYTKLGQACEATDYSNFKPPVAAVPPQVIDPCQQAASNVAPADIVRKAVAMVSSYPKPDGSGLGNCVGHAAFRDFCPAVQSPAGFAALESEEWNNRQRRNVPAGDDPALRMMNAPLTESLKACGLDASDAAVTKLQKQLAATARKEGQWGYVLYYSADEHYPDLQALAKQECSGRSFTNAANQQYLGLCRRYGSALVRDDRASVMAAAGCSQQREDKVRGICVGATASGPGAMAAIEGAAGGGSDPGAANPEEAARSSATDKAREALDKGKKALRGIFGGG